MIIDLILDRKAGDAYNPRDFYCHVLDYRDIWPEISDPITKAMDEKPEQVVKFELCRYVIENGYNPEICDYINSVDWL